MRFGLARSLVGLIRIVPIGVAATGLRAAGIFLLGFPPTLPKFLAGIAKFACGLLSIFFKIAGSPIRFTTGLPGRGIPAIRTIANIARCERKPEEAEKSDKRRAHVAPPPDMANAVPLRPTHAAYREWLTELRGRYESPQTGKRGGR